MDKELIMCIAMYVIIFLWIFICPVVVSGGEDKRKRSRTMSDDEKKIISEFAEYLAMSYDKGMRMSIAMTKSETERFKIKAIYTQFLDAIPKCVESFAEWKEYERGRDESKTE